MTRFKTILDITYYSKFDLLCDVCVTITIFVSVDVVMHDNGQGVQWKGMWNNR